MSGLAENLPDIIKVLAAIKKDATREAAIESIKNAHMQLLQGEVKSRRIKSTEIIMELARIDMAIEEFEVNYVILKEKKCIEQIEALDDYLRDIKKYRRKLANEKKKL